jgi:hypothetical protein
MACTIPHGIDGLPECLCRICHPNLNESWQSIPVSRDEEVARAEEIRDRAERLESRERRKLRAEITDLEDKLYQIKLRKNPPHLIKKVEDALAQAKNDLLMIS